MEELQLPTKTQLYSKINQTANQINNDMKKWEDLAEFLNNMTVADLDTIGVPTGAVRTTLNNFRTMLNEKITLHGGGSVTPTVVHEDVIDLTRTI